MHYNVKDETALWLKQDICQRPSAPAELSSYLEAQANAIELTPLVRSNIQVERVGFTRNAHDTLEDNARLKPDFGGISHSFAVVDPVQPELRLLAATIHFCWEAIAQTRLNQVAV